MADQKSTITDRDIIRSFTGPIGDMEYSIRKSVDNLINIVSNLQKQNSELEKELSELKDQKDNSKK